MLKNALKDSTLTPSCLLASNAKTNAPNAQDGTPATSAQETSSLPPKDPAPKLARSMSSSPVVLSNARNAPPSAQSAPTLPLASNV